MILRDQRQKESLLGTVACLLFDRKLTRRKVAVHAFTLKNMNRKFRTLAEVTALVYRLTYSCFAKENIHTEKVSLFRKHFFLYMLTSLSVPSLCTRGFFVLSSANFKVVQLSD